MNRSVFLLRRVRPLSVLPGTELRRVSLTEHVIQGICCLLYTSDAADEL